MEYELVDRRRHPHPLLFEREGKCDGVCCRCRLTLLFTPSFRCSKSDCNFQIHELCIHLPGEIHSHFHPQHPLSLRYEVKQCQVCDQTPLFEQVYDCSECMFQIDVKCAIANIMLCKTSNGQYVHISHPEHPLTLLISPPGGPQQDGGTIKKLAYCVVCELPIQSGSSTYFCSQCDDGYGHFHKECAELPFQMKIPDHPHPLSLRRVRALCHVCRNQCKGFVYNCAECEFFSLHISCLKSFNHKHNFTRLQIIMEFTCSVCGVKSNDRPMYVCNICNILVDEECVEFPSTLKIYEHEKHDFAYFPYYSSHDEIHCMICGGVIHKNYGGYGCSGCKCFSHFKCAQRRCVEPQSTAAVAAEKKSIEQHFNINIHPHELTVFAPKEISSRPGPDWEYKVCDGCMKCLSDARPSYGCNQCDIFLHEKCAKLPTKIHSRVHPHKLSLISIPNFVFQCEACLQQFHGFAYQCQKCLFVFDVRCVSIQTPFPHPNHQHSLFLYVPDKSSSDVCNACGKKITIKRHAFRCTKTECSFHLDLGCATLPVIVRHRFDQHPLNLTFYEEGNEDYYCDICEEERKPGVWFYSCRECSFEAHTSCALGEFPFVKSAKHKSHKHPLNLVMMKEQGSSSRGCGACIESCARDFTFECGACRFNVHATGDCYDLQLSEGNLAFTNYNVFSRANQPYHHSIHNVVELRPFGSSQGKVWKESVFSSITAFVVYHIEYGRRPIRCIQIQYPKNGNLVWSNHGKQEEESIKSEVSFDYPAEYLVAIHGTQYEDDYVSSLTLETNRKTYGPFGVEEGYKFSSVKEGVKIVGIFGTTENDVVRSIGFLGISTHE